MDVKTNRRWRRNRGVVMPEYVIVVGLVAIAAIATVLKLQNSIECESAMVTGLMPDACIGLVKPLPVEPKPTVTSSTASVEKGKVTLKIAAQVIGEWYTGPVNDDKSPWDEDCFIAGTQVMTDHGLVPIEHITAGTQVLSRDQREDGEEGDDEIAMKEVTATSVRLTDSIVRLSLRDVDGAHEALELTPQHRVFVLGRGWVQAASLAPGKDRLLDATGLPVEVESGEELATAQPVYNLEVDGYHTYFVGERGTWVHNGVVKKKPKNPKPKPPKPPKDGFGRTSWRKATVKNTWNSAPVDPNDKNARLCPTCSKSIKWKAGDKRNQVWDIDHQGATHANRVKELKAREVKTGKKYTRKQVIDVYHMSPLRLQCSACNQGHGHEPTAAETKAFQKLIPDPT